MRSFIRTVLVVMLFLNCKSNQHKKIIKQKIQRSNQIYIAVHMKAYQSFMLEYSDEELNSKIIAFKNPTRYDTTIIKVVSISKPTNVQSGSTFYNSDNKKFNFQQSDFIIFPGDSLYLNYDVPQGLSISLYKRYNKFLDDIFHIDTTAPVPSLITIVKLPCCDTNIIKKEIKQIENYYKSSQIRIAELFSSGEIDSQYKKSLDDYNFIIKYARVANLDYSEGFPPDYLNKIFEQYTQVAENHFEQILSVNSYLQYNILYRLIANEAYIKNKITNNFWNYFDMADSFLISTQAYKNYITSRFVNESKSMTSKQAQIIVDRMKKVGITNPQLKSMMTAKLNYENPENLKDIEIVDVNGQPNNYFNLIKSLKGKYVFVDFWASWCSPCREQMPYLTKTRMSMKQKNIAFVSISIDNDDVADDWIAASRDEQLFSYKYNFRLKNGNKNRLLKLYGFDYVPRYIIYDKNGEMLNSDFMTPNDPLFIKELSKIIK